ncbi:major allergen Pru ar 1-like [Euphorbia lathyris]|uniref:major allergen Pru ar 1-like n=1 Tax=Euphorbia lathyris TaxID=212925 RepID=UPI0033134E69
MGVVTVEKEITSSVPQSTMFKIFTLENHNLLTNVVPHSVEILEGNGGPGSIKKATFHAQGSEFKYIKKKIEAIDKENFSYSYSIIEGEPWSNKLEKITVDIKVESSANGGSIIKTSTKYIPKPNCELDEDEVNANAEKAMGMYKVVEAHILTNPGASN